MSDTQNNENQEQPSKNSLTQPQLCVGCMQFFGNPNQQNLCSKCYNETLAKSSIKSNKPQEIEPKAQTINEEEKKEEITQKDKTHCWKCNKKVGYLGYQCKCLYTFCKNHRLPEQHDCSFNFQQLENEKLKRLNPQLKHDKIEKF